MSPDPCIAQPSFSACSQQRRIWSLISDADQKVHPSRISLRISAVLRLAEIELARV